MNAHIMSLYMWEREREQEWEKEQCSPNRQRNEMAMQASQTKLSKR